jgi:hypothetical protein
MSAVVRPTFYETQILGAADLEAQLQYARTALARHERHQHIYGVVKGLELSLANENNDLVVATGLLIDGTGRQVVIAVATTATASNFQNFGVVSQNDREDTWYPVFVAGLDAPQSPSPFRREQCATQSTSRVDESIAVSFGRPGSESIEPQDPPSVDSTPSGGAGTGSWPVVVGFVQWDRVNGKFKDAQIAPDADHRRRYTGVYADSLVARGGSLALRTHADIQGGKPAMLLQDDPWGFQIGKLKPNGKLEPLLTLNDSGDLTVTGKLKGTLAAGSVVAESGFVSDGVTIPLPAGVTQKMVDGGDAQVCVMLSPAIDQGDAPDTIDTWAGFVLDCNVDDQRQAHCRVRWLRISNPTGAGSIVDRAAAFSYLITASVKQK